ncbi:hypothetical protein H6P81_019183 [Aristolochia fimbriata]|uniref:Binding protein n=1 Tax=Aristolochia fimbriata TaxID=158543 RepID=A0AAV7DRV3_ARIFI|nr:hypothetical protein H6P81_019183 [Aristolochia fimbriata]
MLRFSLSKATPKQGLFLRRGIHSRNKKAMEFVAKGWNALHEVDRVIDYTDSNDPRLFPLYRTAKSNFELALEVDNANTHARYWLSRLHFKYPGCPGACKAIGAALLVEAADMGNADAQYELGCRLRVENENIQTDQQAFYYLEKAVDQMHPGALYLLGAVYLTGDCVRKDIDSAMWCFQRAAQKGHAGAAIAYGYFILKGAPAPKTQPTLGGRILNKALKDPRDMAREAFRKAAKEGCDLGLKWLKVLDDEQHQLTP